MDMCTSPLKIMPFLKKIMCLEATTTEQLNGSPQEASERRGTVNKGGSPYQCISESKSKVKSGLNSVTEE